MTVIAHCEHHYRPDLCPHCLRAELDACKAHHEATINKAREQRDEARQQLQGAVSALTEARALGERWVKHPEHNAYGAALLAVIDAYGGQ